MKSQNSQNLIQSGAKSLAAIAALSLPAAFGSEKGETMEPQPPPAVGIHTDTTPLVVPDSIRKIPVETDYHGEKIVDNYQWLEDRNSPEATEFVKMQNGRTSAALEGALYRELVESLTAKNVDERYYIPAIGESRVFLFRPDPEHPKGLLQICDRRAYLEKKADAPFETLIDIGELSKQENQSWMYAGVTHKGKITDRMILHLSYAGTDRTLSREYDLVNRRFIEDGFRLEGKTGTAYYNATDSVLYAAPTTERNTSAAGYPLEVRLWDRSGAVGEAKSVFLAPHDHMSVSVSTAELEKGVRISLITDMIDFYRANSLVIRDDLSTVRLPLPEKRGILEIKDGFLLFSPEESYIVNGADYKGGVLALDVKAFLESGAEKITPIFRPEPNQSVDAAVINDGQIFLSYTADVVSKLVRIGFGRAEGTGDPVAGESPLEIRLPGLGTVSSLGVVEGEGIAIGYTDFLTPSSFYIMPAGAEGVGEPFLQKGKRYKADHVTVTQEWAVSKDGTRVPFFILDGREEKTGAAPTVLYGYGGFQISLQPSYSWSTGTCWLEKGGIWVVANIRGGGEYGPGWHQAALRENRHLAYEDFIAVGERLIELGLTSRDKLAISGGSNGGLLVSNVMVMRPDLFRAVDCQVPLIDMLRYHKLPPGDSWVAEYGSSDSPGDFRWLRNYSPYHNVQDGTDYPALLLSTSTADDRVHPGHARKLAAKMLSAGMEETYFYEETEGGHNMSDFNSWIPEAALRFAFFHHFLGEKEIPAPPAVQQ